MTNREIGWITTRQIKAARELLSWRSADLARAAGIGHSTIRRIERFDREISRTGCGDDVQVAIVTALERAGITFLINGVKKL